MWPHRALLLSATCLNLVTASPASASASSSAVSSAAVSASGSSAAASAGTASVSAAAGSPESVSTRASAPAAASGSSASAAASGASASAAASGSSASASAASAPADYDYSAPVDYGDYGDYGDSGPSKPSLSFAIFEDTEARPPEETKAAQPSQCTWGVVNCCGNPDARHSRIACFEKLGCNGAWFDDLCTPLVKRGVFKEIFGAIQG